MQISSSASLISALLLSAAPLSGQGGDTCSSPTIITGFPSVYWDSGYYHHNAMSPGSPCEVSLDYDDHYYRWTAPVDGNYQFDTYGATWDSQIAIYDGMDCSATCLAFDDSSFGFYSGIQLENVQAGHVYLIRSAVQDVSHPPFGGLRITLVEPGCLVTEDDRFEDPNLFHEQVPIGNGTYTNLKLRTLDFDGYLVCVGAGDTLQVDALFSNAEGNLALGLLERIPLPGGGYSDQYVGYANSNDDNETLAWTNDTGFDRNVWITLSFTVGPETCVDYSLIVAGAGGCGFTSTTFCDPMDPNTTGQSTLLSAAHRQAGGRAAPGDHPRPAEPIRLHARGHWNQ
ncbi:MAG: hypothetical protein R3F17_01710 [Planctomycetota bacterium]